MTDTLIVIFAGVAILSSLALWIRQPLIIVYIVVGAVLGPHALGWIQDADVIEETGEFGVLFLLFIVGLDLPPKKLVSMLGSLSMTAILSSGLFFVIGFGVTHFMGYSMTEALIVGITCMFSSTVLGVKLLPTTLLHHRHIGEIVIGLLLLQDVIAVAALIYLAVAFNATTNDPAWWLTLASIPVLLVGIYLAARFIIWPLMRKFDVYSDYILLLGLGWCLAIAWIAQSVGIGLELGAFFAGVALANSQAAQSIAQNMSTLRDVLLVLFFFAVGAGLDIQILQSVLIESLIIGVVLIVVKPLVFYFLLTWSGEEKDTSKEVGIRLGQCSEFSILVLYVVAGTISPEAKHVALVAVIITFVISTYGVAFKYKSPMAVFDRLRAD